MEVETGKQSIEKIKYLRQFISKEGEKELEEIFAFWEKYKKKWDMLKKQFWEVCFENPKEIEKQFWYKRLDFVKRLLQYWENEQEFVMWLDDNEQKILKRLWWTARTMFFKEYFYDWILYNWDVKSSYDKSEVNYSGKILSFIDAENIARELENKLQPWMEILFPDANLSLMWLKPIVERWRWKIKPWMYINFYKNDIWDAWIKLLVKEWKDSLQPWFRLELGRNQIWDEWIKFLTEEWKNNLCIWMNISLSDNEFWIIWFDNLLKWWKDSLKPWITLNFARNQIWDDWADLFVNEWKSRLQPWMVICLRNTWISDYWAKVIAEKMELKDWVILDLTTNTFTGAWKQALHECVARHRAQWINCKILM